MRIATTRDETISLNVVISIGMSHEGRMRITSTFLFTLHRTQLFCNTISIAELQTRLLNERWGCIISRRMIIPRLKRMCFLCVALRARSNIVSRSKSYALEKNLLRIFIFSRGDCRIYSISEFESDGRYHAKRKNGSEAHKDFV